MKGIIYSCIIPKRNIEFIQAYKLLRSSRSGNVRHLIAILSLILIVLVLAAVMLSCGFPAAVTPISEDDFVLDTVSTITVYDSRDAEHLKECFDLCRSYENILSRTISTSDIYLLNMRSSDTASATALELIADSLKYCELSGGRLDIALGAVTSLWDFTSEDAHTLPDAYSLSSALSVSGYKNITVDGSTVLFSNRGVQIDLGAVAKGYIADRLKDYLTSEQVGVKSGYINLGGNVLCIGSKPDGSNYTIGIQYPFGEGVIATVEGSDMSVVTSGVYERSFELDGHLYHHILDPDTGYPAESGLLSVTIISSDSFTGDALSTACFVMGLDDGMALIDSLDNIYAIFVSEDYSVHFSSGS